MNQSQIKEMRILYVEDEADIREELSDFLSPRAKELYIAKNGEEGIKLFNEKKPDIVITDIKMPVMDGFDMIKEMISPKKRTPVIVTTAFSDTEFMMRSIELGVDRYVLKPINVKIFLKALESVAASIILNKELERKTVFLKEYKNAVDEAALVTKTDINGIVTYANRKFCEILGYTEKELIGKNHNIMRSPDMRDSLFKGLWETIRSKKVWHGVVKNRAKNGQSHWLNTTIIPILDENGNIVEYIALRQDITELEEYKNDLEAKVKEEIEKRETHENILIRQSRMAEMGEMLGVIAHQWKQPLNNFFLIIQDIKLTHQLGEMDEEYINETVEKAKKSVIFMSETIDDFRNFFRPEQKKELFNISRAVEMVEKILNPQLRYASITYKNEIKDDLSAYGYANEFRQVFLNIVNNAKDAISEKRAKGEPKEITVSACKEKQTVLIKISDTGGGIPEDVIENIFDSYFSTKGEEKGTGLGLYMAKTIIEKKMNGQLSVKNIENGAEFTIRLPDREGV